MGRARQRVAILAVGLFPLVLAACSPNVEALQPNIVLIVVDDLGYSDLGSFGGEINTPNLDALAAQGVTLTNFHTAPTCGPTRAMLMTGIDPHLVGMAANAGAVQRLTELQGRRGYDGHLNHEAVTVATLLSDAGYQTYMVGKWDLAAAGGDSAFERGFKRAFELDSSAGHFADMTGSNVFVPVASYEEDGKEVTELPKDFYSTRSFTEKMLDFIQEGDSDRPFFAYVAHTAPHWPLQVPDDWLDRYSGRYDDGWKALAEERLARQVQMGLIDEAPEYQPVRGVEDWDSLPEETRRSEARKMEIYAAMVEYVDWQIGALLEHIEALPTDRETLVIFHSDNGAEGNDIGQIGPTRKWVAENFNNAFENYGKINSFLWTGPGWAQASSQPLTLYKSFVTEGGTRTPGIIWSSGSSVSGTKSNSLVVASDVPATILAAAGVAHPGTEYKGREILAMEGRSALPILEDPATTIHDDNPIGWELYGNRSVILDEWKAILLWPPLGNGEWQLFNIQQDPAESLNLAGEYPERLADMIAAWETYAERNEIYRFDYDNGYGRY